MTNAKNGSLQLPKAAAERHVEVLENYLTQLVRVMPRRQQDGRQRAAELLWVDTKDFQPPGSHGAPRSLGVTVMAGKDIVQALVPQHLKRLIQPVEQTRRRRKWKEARAVRS